MSDVITIRGTLLPDGTIRLSGPISLLPGEVELTVKRILPPPTETGVDVLDRIRADQRARGYIPRPLEEIQAQLREFYGESDLAKSDTKPSQVSHEKA